jgi:aminodeoxyfutalosine deaminase
MEPYMPKILHRCSICNNFHASYLVHDRKLGKGYYCYSCFRAWQAANPPEAEHESDIEAFVTQMPKVELHVHLEGSVQPATLLQLAKRHQVTLPAETVEGLQKWYTFQDFNHFIQIYMTISRCLRTAEDIELIAREFLIGQARQNIRYSEVTFTPHNQYRNNALSFDEQMDAVNRAREWAERELDVRMGIIMDIPRIIPPEEGELIAEWAISRYGDGLIALGLGGPEVGHPPEKYQRAYDRVRDAGIPCVLHAGETEGPRSIWGALRSAGSRRIGHGVRAVEDPELLDYLREHQIPLEVCPTSNICLKVFPTYESHSLPQLLDAGVYVTINSDDPPMFNTTLTNEFRIGHRVWGWDRALIEQLVMNAVDATLLPDAERAQMRTQFETGFKQI